MKTLTVIEKVKLSLDPKLPGIKARLFVTREDGITIYDSVQNKTTTSVAALVSGIWQGSEALMNLVGHNEEMMEFRFGFDTTSQGIYLFPLMAGGKRYFLGAIYENCTNPGFLKRQISLIKQELVTMFEATPTVLKATVATREGYLFQDITDVEMDRLFSLGGM